jgi:glycosyltransferase involved in cell wall biosynthesis
MARVAVLHNTLDLRGGADAVCLHVCEALQSHHDVSLFTLSRSSLAELNGLFGTDADVAVIRPFGARPVSRVLDVVANRLGPQLAARSVLLERAFRRRASDFDVAVSTANEFALSVPSLQYVHFPQFNLEDAPTGDSGRLNGVWSRLAGVDDRTLPADAILLANSAWTADVVEAIYGRRPTVCFPPVDPISGARPWTERETGVVFVGRLAPDKRPLRAIRVVDGVRERGHDVHLHVVGSASPAYREYARRLESVATSRPYVHLERDASRDRVEHLLTTHRYGLNTKPDEHFGMAVAEYVAAGMLAFAPNSGGQRDVLQHNPSYLYDDVADAVALLSTAIESGASPTLARDRYGSDRFHRTIRRHVDRLQSRLAVG